MIDPRTSLEILADAHLADLARPPRPPIAGGIELAGVEWCDDTYISAATVARAWIEDYRKCDDDEGDAARIDRALETLREMQDREQRIPR